ncbi:MAG: ParB/RepB/Spo0J family partition protein [Sphingomonadales bacterium]
MERVATLIQIDRIAILNPRSRSKDSFLDLVDSIAKVGLKKPITVSRKDCTGPERYDLVCGQGRIEAFSVLGKTEIPAFIVELSDEECLVRSLVENIARRRPAPLELIRELQALRARGDDDAEISAKTGLSADYVNDVLHLLENGEQRLLQGVETGRIPLTVAMAIARTDDAGAAEVLRQAYESNLLRGKRLMSAKALLETRAIKGKMLSERRRQGVKADLDALMKAYREDVAEKQRVIELSRSADTEWTFLVEAFRLLLADIAFRKLLVAEGLDSVPKCLADELAETTDA